MMFEENAKTTTTEKGRIHMTKDFDHLNILEFLGTPSFTHADYVVGLTDNNYNEFDCDWFTTWSMFYNSDWMMDYVSTFVAKFKQKYVVIYEIEANNIKRLLFAPVDSKEFVDFISQDWYKVYEGEVPYIKVTTDNFIKRR